MEVWGNGALEERCRHEVVQASRYRVPEARYGVETPRHGGMEIWRHAVGVAAWRYRGMKLWSCDGAL